VEKSNYREVKLGDLVTIRRGASPRPIQDYISRTHGIPWIKIADATAANGKYIKKTKEFIKEEGAKYSVKVHQGDLILSNSATPGLPKFVNMEACIHDGWLLLTGFKEIDKEYLYYLLLSKQTELIHSARGTVFKNLQTDIVRDVVISLPPLPEQKRISNILSSFDNKIELLRKENNTLEDIAQSIFKEWFVKYNFPNKDGKPYRDNNGKMIDSELGLIPEGWRVGKLGDGNLVKLGDGNYSSKYPKQSDFIENGIPFISNKDIKDRIIVNDSIRYISPKQHLLLKKGHLKTWDILISTRANIGDIALVPPRHNDSNINAQLVYIRPINPELYSIYLFLLFSSKKFKHFFEGYSSGSAQSQLPIASLKEIRFILPDTRILTQYAATVNPLFKSLQFNSNWVDKFVVLKNNLIKQLIK
jgi:type I restriction enzyme S subunit